MAKKIVDTGLFSHAFGIITTDDEAEQYFADAADKEVRESDLAALSRAIRSAADAVHPGGDPELFTRGAMGERDGLPCLDAATVRAHLDMMREHVANEQWREAVAAAFVLGRAFEKMQVRHGEKKVVQVDRTTKKLRAGAAKHCHDEETIDTALKMFDEIMAREPTPKKAAAQREVEKATGVKPRTLRRHLARRKNL